MLWSKIFFSKFLGQYNLAAYRITLSSSYTRTDNQILLLVVTCVPIHSELIKIRNMRR